MGYVACHLEAAALDGHIVGEWRGEGSYEGRGAGMPMQQGLSVSYKRALEPPSCRFGGVSCVDTNPLPAQIHQSGTISWSANSIMNHLIPLLEWDFTYLLRDCWLET